MSLCTALQWAFENIHPLCTRQFGELYITLGGRLRNGKHPLQLHVQCQGPVESVLEKCMLKYAHVWFESCE